MIKPSMLLIGLLLPFSLPASLTYAAEQFGKITLAETSAQSLKKAVSEHKDGSKQPLLIKGTVKKVCEKAGCWMALEDEGQSVRVFIKDHSFAVSNKLKDKTALAEGIMRKRVRTVKDQKHLLEDAGESAEAIAAVKADQTFFEFEATGVKAL